MPTTNDVHTDAVQAPTHAHAHFRRRPGWSLTHGILIVGTIMLVTTLVARPYYYNWLLSGPRIDVVVICDTTDFGGRDFRTHVLYDKVALSPIAKTLGIYQNRPLERIRSYYFRAVTNTDLTPYSLTLHDVPRGPIVRILIKAGDTLYFAPVSDRTVRNGRLYVHLPGK